MLLFPPTKINWLYGYRTPSSMKSEETFKFGNKIASYNLIGFSILSFISGYLLETLFNFSKPKLIFFGFLAISIILTEFRVRKFNKQNGIK